MTYEELMAAGLKALVDKWETMCHKPQQYTKDEVSVQEQRVAEARALCDITAGHLLRISEETLGDIGSMADYLVETEFGDFCEQTGVDDDDEEAISNAVKENEGLYAQATRVHEWLDRIKE